jgi:hypothetical protein
VGFENFVSADSGVCLSFYICIFYDGVVWGV